MDKLTFLWKWQLIHKGHLWSLQLRVIQQRDTPIPVMDPCSFLKDTFGLFVASFINYFLPNLWDLVVWHGAVFTLYSNNGIQQCSESFSENCFLFVYAFIYSLICLVHLINIFQEGWQQKGLHELKKKRYRQGHLRFFFFFFLCDMGQMSFQKQIVPICLIYFSKNKPFHKSQSFKRQPLIWLLVRPIDYITVLGFSSQWHVENLAWCSDNKGFCLTKHGSLHLQGKHAQSARGTSLGYSWC